MIKLINWLWIDKEAYPGLADCWWVSWQMRWDDPHSTFNDIVDDCVHFAQLRINSWAESRRTHDYGKNI